MKNRRLMSGNQPREGFLIAFQGVFDQFIVIFRQSLCPLLTLRWPITVVSISRSPKYRSGGQKTTEKPDDEKPDKYP
jgi:hypothetical protein